MSKYSQINKRYALVYSFCQKILQKKLQSRGTDRTISTQEIQSIIAHPLIVGLIKNHQFDEKVYKLPLQKAIEETRKELFPDLAKKRFVTLELLQDTLINPEESDIVKSSLKFPDLLKTNPQTLPEKIADKISMLKKLYPDFKIPDTSHINIHKKLPDSEIIQIYKNVILAVEKSFPLNFLKYDALNRCRIIVKFLIEILLGYDLNNLQSKLTLEIMYSYKLSNIVRFFNYSISAILQNTYPDLYPLWLTGHAPDGFWNNKENRVKAIKWLVERKLSLNISALNKIIITEKDFILNGLSYLFKQKYNSVPRALLEAYPLLKPWQCGSVPFSYWDDQNAADAVNWMFKRLDWNPDGLPSKYKTGELNRKTFSQFGLAGLFEKKFNCNFYKTINCAYPGKFFEWEFQTVPDSFWQNPENIIRIKDWLSYKKIDYSRNEAVTEEILKYKFYKSFYRVYKNVSHFKHTVNSIHHEYSRSHKIYMRWQKLLSNEKSKTSALNFLIYGFYSGMVKNSTARNIDFIKRKLRRLQRI